MPQATSKAQSADKFLKFFNKLSSEGRERFICSIDPFYFLTRYVKTHDPYLGIRTFPSYGYIESVIHSLQDYRLNIIQKGRQLTFSWMFAAHGLWESQFQFAATSLYTSKRQDDSHELKDRAMFMWEGLPTWLRFEISEDNKSTMAFRKNMSKLKFLPATDNVGRTFTAGHIYMDEFAHVTCDGAKMYTSIKPTINAGGKCTVFSSPNGPYGKFYDLCGGAMCPNTGWNVTLPNGFNYQYMPYDVHPEHDKAWEAEAFLGMTPEEIDQEYRALWIKRGGKIFREWNSKVHVCKPFDIPASWPRARGLDFGGANPTAMLWVAFSPSGQAVVYREYKEPGRTIRDHSAHINEVSVEKYHLGTISDHDSQNRIEYEANGIFTKPAIKDWDSGRNECERHLMINAAGDPGLLVFDTCPLFIQEIEVYSYPEVDASKMDAPEKPLKLNDHLMDCWRYILRTTMGSRANFKPFRVLSERGELEKVNDGLRNHSSLTHLNSLLVPHIGLSFGELHAGLGSREIDRLGL